MAGSNTSPRPARIGALLDIWREHGIDFKRFGDRVEIYGMPEPFWWGRFCRKNADDLALVLPDESLPLPPEIDESPPDPDSLPHQETSGAEFLLARLALAELAIL